MRSRSNADFGNKENRGFGRDNENRGFNRDKEGMYGLTYIESVN